MRLARIVGCKGVGPGGGVGWGGRYIGDFSVIKTMTQAALHN